ncbi:MULTISPECIES: GNAT family N-acetyltransferase [Burkholderia]|uniref:Acetyltransferase n=1 Tax=Burkholderia mayonis TaxID=1385591 RepID=A0A1B4FBJ2_9BURK|nr:MULTISPECIES: GNAT family N-acetyltransferase [Burkholderia]AOJ01050.1 acetyltransferase [Burkholderia mayonis]KVE41996.1 acetyltransferase [Burkholderia sp. BDU5]KVE49902.1 acetyltransferase [Burkholderia mayonis]
MTRRPADGDRSDSSASGEAVPRMFSWRFRAAAASDAHACAPLVFESGVKEFGYFLGEPPSRCIAFLAFAFASKYGRFSWRRHRVAVAEDGAVGAVLAAHDGRATAFDDLHVAWMLLRFFGPVRTIRMLLRGLVLESELPAPKRTQTLIAHCATDERVRGCGAFSALFDDAMQAGTFRAEAGRDVVLDVLTSNVRARALYERLGFVEMPRSRPRSARLPCELASNRMRFGGVPRQSALRAQSTR